jgi:hypothetical protein
LSLEYTTWIRFKYVEKKDEGVCTMAYMSRRLASLGHFRVNIGWCPI